MSKSVRDKTRPVRPNFRRARLPVSRISHRLVCAGVSAAAPSGVPLCASAPPVKGLLRSVPGGCKRIFRDVRRFFEKTRKPSYKQGLTPAFFCASPPPRAPSPTSARRPKTHILRHAQSYQQACPHPDPSQDRVSPTSRRATASRTSTISVS